MNGFRALPLFRTLAVFVGLGTAIAAPPAVTLTIPGTTSAIPGTDSVVGGFMAPIAEYASLESVLANPPANVTLIHSGTSAKSTPTSDPSLYANLTFTALTPCRIYDSRSSQGGPGTWFAGSTNTINVGPNASYAFQGGSVTSCGMTTLIGAGKIAAVMASVSTVNQVGAGYLAFFSFGATNPFPYGVTQSYQPGPVQTSFVVIPTDLVGAVQSNGYTTRQTEVIIDVVGYFASPSNGSISSAQIADGAVTAVKLASNGCNSGQVLKYIGTAWACAADNDTNSGGTVTGVTASAPLASSGGTVPNISLTGTFPVVNGGTGRATLEVNGILLGQGTAAIGSVSAGANGSVLVGTGGVPMWTPYPTVTQVNLVSDGGSAAIFIESTRFIHSPGSGFNTFVGRNAGYSSGTGNGNTGMGTGALFMNTTASNNTAIGSNAMFFNTDGHYNTAVGLAALSSNTTGSGNTAEGYYALNANTTGWGNTASGMDALSGNTVGNYNIALGNGAGTSLTTGDHNIAIGSFGVAAESNTIRIGTSANHTRAFIAGISGVTSSGGVAVYVNASGQLGTLTSSRRFKEDIADMDSASSALMKLRPVTFHYKSDQDKPGQRLQYGLVAEEVADVYPGLVAHSADGQIETVMYQFLPTMLLNEYQKQQRTIQAQVNRIDAQATKIDAQANHIAKLEQDRQVQMARMDALEKHTAKVADVIDQLTRAGTVTARFDLK